MKFRTIVDIPPHPKPIALSEQGLALGSCFAESIGQKLQEALFPICINPLGTLYNPISLAGLVKRALEQRPFQEQEFFLYQELWRHFSIHSNLARTSREAALSLANRQLSELGQRLADASYLILTLGSAWAYWHQSTQQFVGHNHRLPLEGFEKRLLSVEEITGELGSMLAHLSTANPRLRIICSVSPVKHTRDGLRQNNLSKSALLLSLHKLEISYPNIYYFPAYEILIDELRDYRFFREDLAHPSDAAIDYIWERFIQSSVDESTHSTIQEAQAIRATFSHRTQHPDTIAHARSLNALRSRIDRLAAAGIDVDALRQELKRFET
ncbi:GSCFA domain-containing protein [Pelagicoccus sp. SDUM812003]|uniref:GSCFA domain-containing protein n=1 Tax=Pelagicoccus sp. SDUM812003 TaxID=3041267 RepID=UPI00280CDC7E|nr:GSCFA domain-containing protein [Pelagicoccus sp. SDUM812003]MDQ8203251.1 GSCFA domain-containing protein [Pelagicoccus sp. SDUM812003]